MGKKKDEYAIVVGCGRFGAHLTTDLAKENPQMQIVVIDKNKYSFNRLSSEFAGVTLEEDATDVDVLKQANIFKADVLIAATDSDTINILVGQIAKKIFNVPKVVALIFEPSRQEIYDKIEIQTICPSNLTTSELKKLMMIKEEI